MIYFLEEYCSLLFGESRSHASSFRYLNSGTGISSYLLPYGTVIKLGVGCPISTTAQPDGAVMIRDKSWVVC